MPKIYTKTGDTGLTGLLGGGRVGKDDPRIESYGTVDELNASVGVARALGQDPQADAALARVQNDLFALGSALADPNPKGPFHHAIGLAQIQRLEDEIDALETELPRLSHFILPGGSPAGAQIHCARAICRRAERLTVGLARQPEEHLAPAIITYLNRLSDFLFVLARAVNHRAGVPEVAWHGL
jgi:cob(I)alamin adenosyltransferase